jgi:Glycosyltransferase family 87
MPSSRAFPRWLPYAVAALWLALGWASLVRGAGHPGVAYRPWAFDHHAYSDLLAMAGDRYFHGGRPLPYLEDRIEYPPLLALALWLPSFAPGGPAVYFTVGYAFLAACGMGCIALLSRLPGASAWWLAATPALAYYGGLNWDLFPLLLLLAAVVALERGRAAQAGGVLALGVAAKLWPVSLAPPALAALSRRGERGAIARAALAAVAVLAAVNLPIALAAPRAWRWFWEFNAGRGAENSIWELLRQSPRLAPLVFDATFLNAATAVPLAAAVGFAAWAAFRAGSAGEAASARAVRLGTALVIVVWIATSKVWSPQYALWAFTAGALVAAPGWLFAVHALVAPLDYHVAFETRASRGLIHYFDALYTAEEVVRFAAYVLLAAWIGRALWRAARAPAAQDGARAAA